MEKLALWFFIFIFAWGAYMAVCEPEKPESENISSSDSGKTSEPTKAPEKQRTASAKRDWIEEDKLLNWIFDCMIWIEGATDEISVKWSGDCDDGYADGEGTIKVFRSGNKISEYTGEVKRGKPEGKGTFKKDGYVWNGDWENGLFHGRGELTYPKKNKKNYKKYKGEWESNKKDGLGTMWWRDSSKYEGNWKNDVRHGVGTQYESDGNWYKCTWKNDSCEEELSSSWANASRAYDNCIAQCEGAANYGSCEGMSKKPPGFLYDSDWRNCRQAVSAQVRRCKNQCSY